MSGSSQTIECRRCREYIPTESGSCPECGASIRDSTKLVGVVLFGAILVIASLIDIAGLWFFGAIGLVLAVISGYLLWDKRNRLQARDPAEEEPLLE